MLRKILLFVILLFPWFLSTIVPVDYNYYDEIILPFFAPPSMFYGIAWTIVYVLVTVCIMGILHSYKFTELPFSFRLSLIINYLFNQSYTLIFFGLKNNFLGFVSCVGTLISLLFFISEVIILKKNCVKYLIPYLLLSVFAVILSFSIYIINL